MAAAFVGFLLGLPLSNARAGSGWDIFGASLDLGFSIADASDGGS